MAARRHQVLFSLCLVAGCSQAPSEASSDAPDAGTNPPQRRVGLPVQIPCRADDALACSTVCDDRDCLEWCAGGGCVDANDALHACIDETIQDYEAAHPRPELEWSDPPADGGADDVAVPTSASVERQGRWEEGRQQAIDRRWEGVCVARCTEIFDPESETGGGATPPLCEQWPSSLQRWAQLTAAATRPMAEAALQSSLAAQPGMAAVLGSPQGSEITLLLDDRAEVDQRAALTRLVRHQSSALRAAGGCADLEAGAQTFRAQLVLDAEGRIDRSSVLEGDPKIGRCALDHLAGSFWIPRPVAHRLSTIEVRITLRKAGGAFGNLEAAKGLGSEM